MAREILTRSDLIHLLAERYGYSPKVADIIVRSVLDTLSDAILDHKRIEIRGFGSFECKIRDEKKARNPKTGEDVKTGRTIAARFKPGKALKERVDIK